MTYAEQVALLKSCSSGEEFLAKCEYRRGRESAKEDIANDRPNLAETYPYLAELFGKEYARGYAEYYNAWQILNAQ